MDINNSGEPEREMRTTLVFHVFLAVLCLCFIATTHFFPTSHMFPSIVRCVIVGNLIM